MRFCSLRRLVFPLAVALSLLVSCGDDSTSPEPDEGTKIPETTHVLADSTLDVLESISVEADTLIFSAGAAQAAALESGDVVVIDRDWGFLRKVELVLEEDGQIIIITSQATLEDAIEQGRIQAEYSLEPESLEVVGELPKGMRVASAPQRSELLRVDFLETLVDLDADPGTTEDQVTIEGYVEFGGLIEFTVAIEDFEIRECRFTLTLEQNAFVELVSSIPIASLEKRIQVLPEPLCFRPLRCMVGPVPVVLVPCIQIVVGGEGSIEVDFRAGVGQDARITAAIEYDGQEWAPASELTHVFRSDPPTVRRGCHANGYAGPELSLLVYGVTGPYARLKGCLDMLVTPGENPWWLLSAGVAAAAGVKVDALGHNRIADHEFADLIDLREEIASSPANSSPTAAFDHSPDSGTISTVFDFDASTSTDQESPLSEMEFRWDWEDDATFDTDWLSVPVTTHQFLSTGAHTVRLEVRDPGGLTDDATREITISLENTPPVACFSVSPESGLVTREFEFDATCTEDAEDPPGQLEFHWDWDNDGVFDLTGIGLTDPTHQFAEPGFYEVVLWVVDSGDASDRDTVVVAVSENLPPCVVADLATGEVTTTAVELTWTAPGADSCEGTATEYDIRYSTSQLTLASWTNADQAEDEPTPMPAGTPQSFVLQDLTPDRRYFVSLKARDEDSTNWSGMAPIVDATTAVLPQPVFASGVELSAAQITLGESFTLTASVRNDGSATNYGGISISFPDFTVPSDGQWISSSSGGDDPGHEAFAAGSMIHDADCQEMEAVCLLAEYGDTEWQADEANEYILEIQPQELGIFTAYVRARFQVGEETACDYAVARPPNGHSGYIDQQGWDVKMFQIEVSGPPPPAPVFTEDVMIANEEITLGQSFTVTATVRNDGTASNQGWISISFPSFTNPSDGQWISSTSSGDNPGHAVFLAGSPIYDAACQEMAAEYLLAEYGDLGWNEDETNIYSVTVRPQDVGPFSFYVQAALRVDGETECEYVTALPPNGAGGYTDQRAWPVKRFEITVTDSGPIPDDMALVPAGTFIMGDGVALCGHDERVVTLTRAFYLGQHEVTNQEYLEAVQWAYEQGFVTATSSSVHDNLDGSTPELLGLDDSEGELAFSDGTFSLRDIGYGINPDHPVKEVTWYGATRYCDWLSMQEGRPRAYAHGGNWSCNDGDPYTAVGYRLPTDAEWEYAAQYNDDRKHPWGNHEPTCEQANYTGCVGWTSVVGSYPEAPAELGLLDMGGNLWEWCNDWRVCELGTDPVTDPTAPLRRTYRVHRGGNWRMSVCDMRCASRNGDDPGYGSGGIGFRIARTVLP
jgi:formylglycine-generating enzyme required for sulfatase activity